MSSMTFKNFLWYILSAIIRIDKLYDFLCVSVPVGGGGLV